MTALETRPAPRWWITAVLATSLGVIGLPVVGTTSYLFHIALPLGLLALAAVVFACLAVGHRRPDANAVAVGLVLSLLVSAALGTVLLGVLERGLP